MSGDCLTIVVHPLLLASVKTAAENGRFQSFDKEEGRVFKDECPIERATILMWGLVQHQCDPISTVRDPIRQWFDFRRQTDSS